MAASRKTYQSSFLAGALAAILIVGTTALAVPASAQDQLKVQLKDQPQQAQPKVAPPLQERKIPEPPSKLPRVGGDRTKNLDFLFGALKAAPDEDSAKHVEARIWALWMMTPSDTASLLMSRAKTAIESKDTDVALQLLDAVIKLRPDYTEGWDRRAMLYYARNDYARALADIKEVLILEPRHFGALAGLGMIMQELGEDKRALDAFRKALDINPHIARLPEMVKTLSEKVEGRDI